MEKRTLLAITFSLLVLVVWSTLMPKPQPQPVVNKEVVVKEAALPSALVQAGQPSTAPAEFPAASLFEFGRDSIVVTFVEPLAAIKEIRFKAHQDAKLPLKYGFSLVDTMIAFKKVTATSDAVTFVHEDSERKITKKYVFSKSKYDIWLELTFENLSSAPLRFDTSLILGELDFAFQNIQSRYQGIAAITNEKSIFAAGRKDQEFAGLKFLGIHDRYFCAILDPDSDAATGFVKKLSANASEIGVSLPDVMVKAGGQIGQKFHLYLGPQQVKSLDAIKPEWATIVNYGTFDFISQILLQVLEFIYRLVGNWGLAIVILSILVFYALYPLTLKQMRSMKEMQAVQPKIEELRKAYKDNPQKLNKEIMELYKTHKVNPLSGCLPLLLQMPIFFALYQALMRSIALKGAQFLWIKDLSEPDRLFMLPKSLPILGNEINILPIVMAIEMFVQQKFSMPAASSSSAEQQKMMMFLMPILFGFIFYKMPSGLVLYWFVNSTLMLINQIRTSRAK